MGKEGRTGEFQQENMKGMKDKKGEWGRKDGINGIY
jgi:hypothetical protein